MFRTFVRETVNGILRKRGYELRRRHDFGKFLAGADLKTIIDGGANIGEFTEGMRTGFSNAHIHAFEPTPHLFQRIRAQFAQDKKITCYELALGDREGAATFHVAPDTVSSSLLDELEQTQSSGSVAVTVSLTTLDAWAREHSIARPSLLKLDVEGNELAALQGAVNTLSQIDYITLETTFVMVRRGQPTFREIVNFVHEHGFDLIDIYPGIVDAQSGRTNWLDALFARR